MNKILNTYVKKFRFFDFMSSMFAFDSIFFFSFYCCTSNLYCLFALFVSLLICFIFDIYRDKYFKLTYQFKKNANKER